MDKNNKKFYLAKKIKKFVLYNIVFKYFLLFSLLQAGINKVKAQFSVNAVNDTYYTLPNPPTTRVITDYLDQREVLSALAIIALLFPFRMYVVLSKYFVRQFTFWEIIKNILIECYSWSLFLIIIGYTISAYSWLRNTAIFYIFLCFIFVAGIEALVLSLKNKRFIKIAIFLLVISIPAFAFLYEAGLYLLGIWNNFLYHPNYLESVFLLINFLFGNIGAIIGFVMLLISPFFMIYELCYLIKNIKAGLKKKEIVLMTITFIGCIFLFFSLNDGWLVLSTFIIIGPILYLARSIINK